MVVLDDVFGKCCGCVGCAFWDGEEMALCFTHSSLIATIWVVLSHLVLISIFHSEYFGHHAYLVHVVIISRHLMRFGFQDDNQQVGIWITGTLAVHQVGLIAGSLELT